MKISSDFLLQQVGGTYLAVAVGEASKTFHAMVKLNETGAFLWELLSKEDLTEEEVIAKMAEEYDAPMEQISKDVHAMIATLKEQNILQ